MSIAMGVLIIIFSVTLLAVLSYKGVHVILSAFIASGVLALLLRMDVYTALAETMMSGTGGFIQIISCCSLWAVPWLKSWKFLVQQNLLQKVFVRYLVPSTL